MSRFLSSELVISAFELEPVRKPGCSHRLTLYIRVCVTSLLLSVSQPISSSIFSVCFSHTHCKSSQNGARLLMLILGKRYTGCLCLFSHYDSNTVISTDSKFKASLKRVLKTGWKYWQIAHYMQRETFPRSFCNIKRLPWHWKSHETTSRDIHFWNIFQKHFLFFFSPVKVHAPCLFAPLVEVVKKISYYHPSSLIDTKWACVKKKYISQYK